MIADHHCDCWLHEGVAYVFTSMNYVGWTKLWKNVKVRVFCSLLSLNSHYGGGGRLRSIRAQHQALGDVVAVDLAQRRAQRVEAGAVLARPVRQERADGVLFLPEGGDPLLLVSQEACQVAPVAVVHVVAVVSFAAPEQQLLHFLSGVERKEQTGLFIQGDNCRGRRRSCHFFIWAVLSNFSTFSSID